MVTNIVIIAAVVLFLGVYVSWRAGRLDRMHTRLEAAHAALDVTLVRRSSVALELASSGLLDPATSLLLAEAAHEARGTQSELTRSELTQNELAQSNLSRALRAAFAQPGFRASLTGKDGADEMLAEVEAAAQQVFVARTFYNNAVAVTREARSKPLVRLLRLAGKAGLPEFFEMDDSPAAEGGESAGADMQRLAG
jgi:hypothetical protein